MNLSSFSKATPMMQQWFECKKRAGSSILFFRMGDFYEAFYEDAEILAKALSLSLTKRQDIPMAGVPVHTCDSYIDKLVCQGFTVAVAEQMEDPKEVKGIVKREVTRFITPGSVINSSLLQDKTNNYFSSLSQIGSTWSLASLDLSTGEFFVTEFSSLKQLQSELYKIDPKELLLQKRFANRNASFIREVEISLNPLVTIIDDWHFAPEESYHFLLNHFGTSSLDGFGLKEMPSAHSAAGALLKHIGENLQLPIKHIERISPYTTASFLLLDQTTQKNLELTSSSLNAGKNSSLLSVIDQTLTPMGGRLLRKWLLQPLTQDALITQRQQAVQEFIDQEKCLTSFRQSITPIRDLERLIMRISTGYAFSKDLVQLKTSLMQLPEIIETLSSFSSVFLTQKKALLTPLTDLTDHLEKALVEDPPLRVGEGKTFKAGFCAQLDELNALKLNASTWMHSYQEKIRELTGIKTLKVGFTRMFGYFIEVSKAQSNKMPDSFTRRQTLVNGERFISPELKEFEQKVFSAEEKINVIEQQLFHELKEFVTRYSLSITKIANAIAHLDCIASLAYVALSQNYTRPLIDSSKAIDIQDGRHPVIEKLFGTFTPNDTFLDSKQQLILLTGPNMAGKSTYIRQVALIVILAQIGSFVPAKYARIGIVDKIFTRIGAHDDLSRGQSTFMVEMIETANILNNATSRSLVVLDEIGRGTSTYDGISIAWSVAEYLLQQSEKNARTLFATHYFELTKLEELYPNASNYSVAAQEESDSITFLHKIVKGSADRSYGILVAKLAGLPFLVIQRAKEILTHLEDVGKTPSLFSPPKRKPSKNDHSNKEQLSFFR